MAHADSEARAQLELRNTGAGSAGQRGVSQFLPDRDREGAGRENAGSVGTSDRSGHAARVARSDRGTGAATRSDPWAEDAGGHDGRCSDIVLYLAMFLKTGLLALHPGDFAELAIDS